MITKSSQSVLAMKADKAVPAKALTLEMPNSRIVDLYPENRLSQRFLWFKGSRDRGLREDIAA